MVTPDREIPGSSAAAWKMPDHAGARVAEVLDGAEALLPARTALRSAAARLLAPAQHLGAAEDGAVDDQEDRRRAGMREQRLQRVLEEEPDHGGRDGADHEQVGEPLIGRLDASSHRGPEEADDDPPPLVPVQDDQRHPGPEVEKREEGHEALGGRVDPQVEEGGDHHGVAERGHRKQFRGALESREEDDEARAHGRRA